MCILFLDLLRMPNPTADQDLSEFAQVQNLGSSVANISGWTLEDSEGLTFTFPSDALLGPGDSFVVTRDAGAFSQEFPGQCADYSGWTAQLGNSGDSVLLRDADGQNQSYVEWRGTSDWTFDPASGETLVRIEGSDTGTSADWTIDPAPTVPAPPCRSLILLTQV